MAHEPDRQSDLPDEQVVSDVVSESPSRPALRGLMGAVREVAVVVVVALLLSAFVRTFLLQAFYVPSASMENTLLINDRIVASKITTRIAGVQRGDIVVFQDPGSWLSPIDEPAGFGNDVRRFLTYVGLMPSKTGDDLVKRVIGIGGDRVVCCDATGHITVNSYALTDASYLPPAMTSDQVKFDVVVPKDHIFVMGDNRSNSEDSRFHLDLNNGSVPVQNVVGRVVVRLWPFDRLGFLGRPDSFSKIPNASK